jgi:NAD(P)-dependent dehydrogenase (short-subunit alcohol dehydrogenase family)
MGNAGRDRRPRAEGDAIDAMPRRFGGKAVIITGAASGIGLASARRFAREGAVLGLVDIDEAALDRCAAELSSSTRVVGRAADVADERQLGAAFDALAGELGRVDVLHANAGVVVAGGLEDEGYPRFRRTLDVNVGGAFLACRSALPHMIAAGGGSIVTTGSISGMVAEPALLAYCTSKAAINHMTRQIAVDYAARNVRVNAVCPGWIDTPFNDFIVDAMSPDELDEAVRAVVPMLRQGTAEEVASAVAFLASDEASYITGHCLVVDGGYTLR